MRALPCSWPDSTRIGIRAFTSQGGKLKALTRDAKTQGYRLMHFVSYTTVLKNRIDAAGCNSFELELTDTSRWALTRADTFHIPRSPFFVPNR
jgi:hypothetical protein